MPSCAEDMGPQKWTSWQGSDISVGSGLHGGGLEVET